MLNSGVRMRTSGLESFLLCRTSLLIQQFQKSNPAELDLKLIYISIHEYHYQIMDEPCVFSTWRVEQQARG